MPTLIAMILSSSVDIVGKKFRPNKLRRSASKAQCASTQLAKTSSIAREICAVVSP